MHSTRGSDKLPTRRIRQTPFLLLVTPITPDRLPDFTPYLFPTRLFPAECSFRVGPSIGLALHTHRKRQRSLQMKQLNTNKNCGFVSELHHRMLCPRQQELLTQHSATVRLERSTPTLKTQFSCRTQPKQTLSNCLRRTIIYTISQPLSHFNVRETTDKRWTCIIKRVYIYTDCATPAPLTRYRVAKNAAKYDNQLWTQPRLSQKVSCK